MLYYYSRGYNIYQKIKGIKMSLKGLNTTKLANPFEYQKGKKC